MFSFKQRIAHAIARVHENPDEITDYNYDSNIHVKYIDISIHTSKITRERASPCPSSVG